MCKFTTTFQALFAAFALVLCGCEDENDPVVAVPAEAQPPEITLLDEGLCLSTAPIEGANAYAWMLEGELTASTVAPTFVPEISGNYSVAGVNSAGMGPASQSVFVDLSGVPEAPVLSTTVSDEGMITIVAAATGAIGFRWYFEQELMQRGKSDSFIPPVSGTYRVEAYNASGTGPAQEISVTVEVVNLLDPNVVPDPAFRQYIALNLAGNTDFYSSIDAASVEEINFQGTGVADITGIRFFSGLKRLLMQYCSNVLVMDLRHNSQLEVLDLYNTKKLRSVNIAGLTNIRQININDSNLGSIDVSDCLASLEYLNAGWQNFESLDLSGAKNLKYLNLGSNTKLSSVQVAGLSKLQTLILSSTKLSELDLTGCASLQSLSCSWSPIRSLKIDANAPLQELKVARCSSTVLANIDLANYRKTLQVLYADEAGITQDLDFSECVALTEVQLDKNNFKHANFNGCSMLAKLRVAENPSLETVTLYGCSDLTTIYCYQTGITELDFSDCPLLGMAILFENSKLSSVDFTDCARLYWLSAEYTALGPDVDISASSVLENVNFLGTNVKRVKIHSSYNLTSLPFTGKLPVGASFVHEF